MWTARMIMRLAALTGALSALATLLAAAETPSELVVVVSLSRHGSLAPSPSVKTLCPNNLGNVQAYAVPPHQLTEHGMEQLEATGRHIREVYVQDKKFLSPSFSGDNHEHFEAYFRADSATLCGQSATAMGFGLYPDGTGPQGYTKQPIPVFMQLSENEHDFSAAGPCRSTLEQDSVAYFNAQGSRLIMENIDMLNRAAAVCGATFHDLGQGKTSIESIKDVVTMFTTDKEQGLPLIPGLTDELVAQLNALAFQQYIERLYATRRQVTYMVGGFPTLLRTNLNSAVAADFDPQLSTKYYSYHGHGELLHGLGFVLGTKFHFDGLPEYNGSTALLPGTTMLFEVHRMAGGQHIVRVYVWAPSSSRTQVKLADCALDCPLAQFNSILEDHVQQTGTWQDICSYHPTVLSSPEREAHERQQQPGRTAHEHSLVTPPGRDASPWQWVLPTGLLVAIGTACSVAYRRFLRRRHYEEIV